jgi:hypothetical protein
MDTFSASRAGSKQDRKKKFPSFAGLGKTDYFSPSQCQEYSRLNKSNTPKLEGCQLSKKFVLGRTIGI